MKSVRVTKQVRQFVLAGAHWVRSRSRNTDLDCLLHLSNLLVRDASAVNDVGIVWRAAKQVVVVLERRSEIP